MGQSDTTAAPEQRAEPPALGLRGLWRDVGNLSAVAIIAVLFYRAVGFQQDIIREDRASFRASQTETVRALQDLHQGQAETAKAIRALTHELRHAKDGEP